MRLSFVTETWPPEINGVALTVQSLVHRLRERLHSVEVIRPRQPADSAPRFADATDEMLMASSAVPGYPGIRFGWPAGGRLRTRWRMRRPDAVYVATEGPLGWSALGVARTLDIPALAGFHTRFDDYLDHYGVGVLAPVARAWLRRFHNRAQATLVPTTALQSELNARGLRDVRLLRRGVDSLRFAPGHRSRQLRAEWGMAADDLAVLHVGRLAPEKNLGLLVESFRAIQSLRADAKLVLVGEGPSLPMLREAVPHALFCGMRGGADLPRHYASGDLFLFPSLSETYGNVTLEALASGVPVVAFAQGSAVEFLHDGCNGAAIQPPDHAAFLRASVALAGDDAGRESMRAAARASVAALHPRQVAIDFESMVVSVAGHFAPDQDVAQPTLAPEPEST